ncbi:MAG: lysine-2,3-aminomutase-like protein [Solirubrobacterales bacterium]
MSTDPIRRRKTLRTAADLIAAGLASEGERGELAQVAERFAVAVSPAVADLIDPADPADPVARQYVPAPEELAEADSDRPDPIGDEAYSPVKGIVHRYPDRVLLKPVMVCPVYCRFCFRREVIGDADGTLSETELERALAYVAGAPAVREVVVTGGDPFMLPPPRLAALVSRIARIPHIDVLRFHTRVPVADPERVTAALAQALKADLAVWVAVHVNHPRELSPLARRALACLAEAGLPLLSQTVLLKGVNDDPLVLEALFRALVRNRVKPYYLHHPDLARGTAHLRPTIEEGRAIVKALRGRLSGIAQPTYVLDIPGGAGKVPIGPEWWDEQTQMVEDWRGARHPYPPR